MEEIEVPTEQAQEEIHHHAMEHKNSFTMAVALSSAILAALAAVTALMSGHHSNEAMIEQLQASDQWGYYQAKGIKAAILSSKIETLKTLSKHVDQKELGKLAEYKNEQSEIQEKAKELEKESRVHLERHLTLARGVTLFQVAIAVAAISVLTHRRRYWYVSLVFGACGLIFLLQELIFT